MQYLYHCNMTCVWLASNRIRWWRWEDTSQTHTQCKYRTETKKFSQFLIHIKKKCLKYSVLHLTAHISHVRRICILHFFLHFHCDAIFLAKLKNSILTQIPPFLYFYTFSLRDTQCVEIESSFRLIEFQFKFDLRQFTVCRFAVLPVCSLNALWRLSVTTVLLWKPIHFNSAQFNQNHDNALQCHWKVFSLSELEVYCLYSNLCVI